ncbi:MAG: redox-sensing transcriptional repressor Rex [Oscillospiraceae bacterium]|nr:redox-sensing transcriptional repressor Rex [Oscillospiraceae bacterium]
MPKSIVSSPVIKRLPRYFRFLGELERNGIVRISSRELSERMGFTASQIRQDLNCFGGFGQQGYGYNVPELRAAISRILGIDAGNPTVLIGAGNLGKALTVHMDFNKRGFKLIGIFDKDPQICGTVISELPVMPIEKLESFCEKNNPVCAILCIPKTAAEKLIQRLTDCGIKAFWNFSHYDIRAVDGIVVENVHLSDSLMTLAYGLNNPPEK